jgi:aspartate-semialdehyde dehydrogenase
MKKVNVGVLGCTGVVGRQMMKVLEEYHIPVDRFVPLASASSAGKTVVFNNIEYTVQEATVPPSAWIRMFPLLFPR